MELCYDCDSMSDWEGSHTVGGQRMGGLCYVLRSGTGLSEVKKNHSSPMMVDGTGKTTRRNVRGEDVSSGPHGASIIIGLS